MDQILANLIKYILGIIGVGTIVILHELGHFIAAHFNGIEVEIFSLGFGPKLIGFKWGKTEYRISLILFGGYCRLKGSDDLTRALDTKATQFEHIEHGSLFSVHPINRMITYLGGPFMNIVISIILCTILLTTSHQTLSTPSMVTTVNDYPTIFNNSTSPSFDGGIRTGDIILSIDNQKMKDYQEVVSFLNDNESQQLSFIVKRDNEILKIDVLGEINENGKIRFGLSNIFKTKIATVRLFSPEKKAGLQKNDLIIGINGVAVNNNLDVLKELEKNGNSNLSVKVERDNERIEIEYLRKVENEKSKNNFAFASPTKTIKGLPFIEGIKEGASMAIELFTTTLTSLFNVLKGKKDNVREVLTGPIRASLMIGDITIMGLENNFTSGLRALCYLLAIVSTSVAIANLIPLPAFDGGQILIALLEIISGKKISPKHYWVCQLIGMLGLIAIFSCMYFIDIRYFYKLHYGK